MSTNVYLTQTALPPPPVLHRWAAGSSPDPAEFALGPRRCSLPPWPPGNEGRRVQGEGRQGTPGPSPSYVGSEPSAGNSMAGGAGTASAPLHSASRPRAPELPPSMTRRARVAAQQPASQPTQHCLTLH